MGAGDRVTVHGAENVQRTLRNLADDLDDLDDAADSAGRVVVAAAQGFAPRRTGALRASVTYVARKAGSVEVSAGSGIPRPYPAVQEYGSPRHGIKPVRYMRRAADTQEQRVVNEYETAVSRAADKVKGI
jgi:Bacteriophage HK97-gp10, putative tail-component